MKGIVTVSILGLFLTGCGAMKGLEAAANRDKLLQVSVGMTKEQVRQVMGKPYRREVYEPREIWFYITEWQKDGYTTSDEMTPLVFEDGKLVGWGSQFVDEDLEKYELRIR